jgi:hypothetical protein
MSFHRVLGASVIAASCACQTAMADTADQTRAKQLYDEGQAAMKSKDYATACKRFQESYRISGIPGSLLNWADCEESAGHVGTAFNLWNEGAALVVRDPDRKAFVDQRIQAISPRVPRLHIAVASPDVKQVHATLDGANVDANKPIPADPGSHKIVVSAPGFADETASVTVDFGEQKDVPVFANPRRVAGATSPDGKTQETPHGNPTLRTAGWIVGGVGVLGVITFGATGGAVLGLCKGHLGSCPADQRSTVGALDIVNVVGLGVGIAGLATGGILIGVGSAGGGKSASTTAASAGVFIGPTSVEMRGTF